MENEIQCLLPALDYSDLRSILLDLCNDSALEKKTTAYAMKKLDAVCSTSRISEEVFSALNQLDVFFLYEHSGDTYYGYVEPTDFAYDMVEDVLRPYNDTMKKIRKLNLNDYEMDICKGMILGLRMYEKDGSNEFCDWIPDGATDFIENIFDEFSEHHSKDLAEEIRQWIDESCDGSNLQNN